MTIASSHMIIAGVFDTDIVIIVFNRLFYVEHTIVKILNSVLHSWCGCGYCNDLLS